MSASEHVSSSSATYQVDTENAAEMARLVKQARMLSEQLGLLPPDFDLTQARTILDIGCGPGAWALEIARQFPDSQVIGIDISERMIAYATYTAQEQQLANVRFQVMNASQPFTFADATFDVVHTRFITGFLSTTTWPLLLRECFRVLRPGATLLSLEFEDTGLTTSPSLTQYNHLLIQAARKVGQCFAPEGDHYGIAAVLPRLLREAGFQHIHQYAHVMNFSAGMPAHSQMYDNFRTLFKLMQPFLVRSELTTHEELNVLFACTMAEMQAEDFDAAVFFHRVRANKPAG